MSDIGFTGPGESIQRLRMDWSDDFTDQHGRRFAAAYDIRNGRPIGELSPVDHNPPWLPPQRFIRWPKPKGGFRFSWDYEAMANELAGDSRQYYQDVHQFMTDHMPGQTPPEDGEPVPSRVRMGPLGRPPLSPAIPLACLAGDPWMLGVPGAAVNQELKDVLEQTTTANARAALSSIREKVARMANSNVIPAIVSQPIEEETVHVPRTIDSFDPEQVGKVTYKEFIAGAMKDGRMSMAEAAAAWKAHRENLALDGAA